MCYGGSVQVFCDPPRQEDIVAFVRLPRGEALAHTLVETPEASGTRLDGDTPDKDGHRVHEAREVEKCATLAPLDTRTCGGMDVASQGDVPDSAWEDLDARADWAFEFLDGMDAQLKAALPDLAAYGLPANLKADVPEDNEAVMSALAERLGAGAAGTAEPEEEDDAELAALRDQAQRGVDIRSSAGQRFARDPAGGQGGVYKQLDRAGKAEFRKLWAAQQYERTKALKQESKSYQRVQESAGVYLPLTRIVQEQGGDKAAITATKNYVAQCLLMRGKWVKYNSMTCRYEYLFVQEKTREVFEESWRLFEEYQSKPAAVEAEAPMRGDAQRKRPVEAEAAGTAVGPAAKKPKQDTTGKQLEAQDTVDAAKKKTAKQDKTGRQLETQDKIFAAAQTTKKMYVNAMSQARQILN